MIQPDIRRNGKVEVMSILQVLEGVYRIEVEEQLLDPTVSLPLLEDQAAPLNHDIEILLVADFNTLKASHRVRVRKDLEYIRPGRISGCDLRRTCLSSCCSFPSAPSALCRRKPFEHFLHHGRSHPELCGVRSAPSQGCSAPSARSAPLWRLGGNTGPQPDKVSKVRNQSRAAVPQRCCCESHEGAKNGRGSTRIAVCAERLLLGHEVEEGVKRGL